MDFSKFKTSDWLKIGGGVAFLIFGFLNWVTASIGGVDVPGADTPNVFDFFWTGTLPWILVLGTAVVTFLMINGTMKAGGLPWPLIMLAATGLAALLLLIRVLFNPIEGADAAEKIYGIEFSRGIGMIGSVIGGCVAFAGALMGFTESGGNLSDLKDMNKMKSQFGGGNSAPPPPPPGMPPPPPPR